MECKSGILLLACASMLTTLVGLGAQEREPGESYIEVTPADGAKVATARPRVTIRIRDKELAKKATVKLLVDGVDVTAQCKKEGEQSVYQPEKELKPGQHAVMAFLMAGETGLDKKFTSFAIDVTPPEPPTLSFPQRGVEVRTFGPAVVIGGRNEDATVRVTAQCKTAEVGPVIQGAEWKTVVRALKPGEHHVTLVAEDAAGNVSKPGAITIVCEEPVPGALYLSVTSPAPGEYDVDKVDVKGLVSRQADVELVDASGEPHEAIISPTPDKNGQYEWSVKGVDLERRGYHLYTVQARDAAGAEALSGVIYLKPVIMILKKDADILQEGMRISSAAVTVYFYVRDWPEVSMIEVTVEHEKLGKVKLADTNFCVWDLRELKDGKPRWPNGTYKVTYTAGFSETEIYSKTFPVENGVHGRQ